MSRKTSPPPPTTTAWTALPRRWPANWFLPWTARWAGTAWPGWQLFGPRLPSTGATSGTCRTPRSRPGCPRTRSRSRPSSGPTPAPLRAPERPRRRPRAPLRRQKQRQDQARSRPREARPRHLRLQHHPRRRRPLPQRPPPAARHRRAARHKKLQRPPQSLQSHRRNRAKLLRYLPQLPLNSPHTLHVPKRVGRAKRQKRWVPHTRACEGCLGLTFNQQTWRVKCWTEYIADMRPARHKWDR